LILKNPEAGAILKNVLLKTKKNVARRCWTKHWPILSRRATRLLQFLILNAMKRKSPKSKPTAAAEAGRLQGWRAIADYLAMPVTTAQRWARSGMPVRREGRFTVADADELRRWLGSESKMPAPAHIATNQADLATGLKESISAIRKSKRAA
jgi:hypothetical protein